MQHSPGNPNSASPITRSTETMGHPYRTPSRIAGNVGSPQVAFESHATGSDDQAKYQQRIRSRASSIVSAGGEKPDQLYSAEMSRISSPFAAGSDSADQTFNHDTATLDRMPIHQAQLREDPCTPKKRRAPIIWHGLPSPETPSFQSNVRESPSTGSAQEELRRQTSLEKTKNAFHQYAGLEQHHTDTDNGDTEDVKPTIPQTPESATKNDAMFARELEELVSPTTTRRSTRIRRQPKPMYTLKVPVAAPKTARKLLSSTAAPESAAQPEFSSEPVKADPIPFDGLPTVHSLSWQLQYPPGGSTHPSYPYPAMDPRLLFHQAFVPIIGGLPDFTLVPKLVLPMGWKHVSWSGLLPIAFDPYRQAFKLTPIGPMPLTSEELHQQGLHKYVPGGELHPEYGLVPEMLKLSDGSDADIFNFDGVDWTLPWKGQIDFHAPSHAASEQYGSYDLSSPIDSDTFTPVVTYPWREARDCPNKIFELYDAWRWLSTKETDPKSDFIPTPEMKWHGTGAVRSNRKLKSPIPELMMLAMQSAPTTPNIKLNVLLQNQDHGNKDKNQFCAFKSVATAVIADITLLGDTEFTIVELLCYFPQHYYWGHAAERLARAGVTGSFIRDFIIMTRGLQGDEIMMSSSIACAAKAARKRDCMKLEETEKVEDMDIDEVGKDTPSPTPTPATNSMIVDLTSSYTAEGWVYNVWEKIDYPLLALAHGLQSLPTGPDAGPLTALILWCKEKVRYQAMLSEVPALLKEAEIEPLIEPGEHGCPDKAVAGRHAGVLKKDRLRVVRDAGANKRALDASVSETQGKRTKAE